MIRKYLQDYFTFTKGERNAVIGLSLSLLVLFAIPYFLPEEKLLIDETAFAKTAAMDPTTKRIEEPLELQPVSERFQFDPNTLEVAGWVKLGLKEKTAITIRHYLEKGGKFRSPDDLLRIYGMPPALAAELVKYVRIAAGNLRSPEYPRQRGETQGYRFFSDRSGGSNYSGTGKRNDYNGFHNRPEDSLSFKEHANKYPRYNAGYTSKSNFAGLPDTRRKVVVDISLADTTELIALPGIGSKLAKRIISFREKLGGFYAVEQLKDLFGLTDSVYQILKPMLKASPGNLSKININTANEEILRAHPYLRWQLAKAIISYRKEHGAFTSIEDLLRIDIIDKAGLEKLRPYLEM